VSRTSFFLFIGVGGIHSILEEAFESFPLPPYELPSLEGKSLGKSREIGGRNIGRHAQTMPIFSSITVHIDEVIWSNRHVPISCHFLISGAKDYLQVVSGLVLLIFNVVIRRILVVTTKLPRAKTSINAIFRFLGSFKVYNEGIGRHRMIKSVAIENPAFANLCKLSPILKY
jgi:hypothetical protein